MTNSSIVSKKGENGVSHRRSARSCDHDGAASQSHPAATGVVLYRCRKNEGATLVLGGATRGASILAPMSSRPCSRR